MKTIIGIDPGSKAGWAAALDGKSEHISLRSLGGSEQIDVAAFIEEFCGPQSEIEDVVVVIEQPPRDMGKMRGQRATSGLFLQYGMLIGALAVGRVPFFEVPPATWKSALFKGQKRSKEMTVPFVRKAFPKVELSKTNKETRIGQADAICLAWYGRSILHL